MIPKADTLTSTCAERWRVMRLTDLLEWNRKELHWCEMSAISSTIHLPFVVFGVIYFDLINCSDAVKSSRNAYFIIDNLDAEIASWWIHTFAGRPAIPFRIEYFAWIQSKSSIIPAHHIDVVSMNDALQSWPDALHVWQHWPFIFVYVIHFCASQTSESIEATFDLEMSTNLSCNRNEALQK